MNETEREPRLRITAVFTALALLSLAHFAYAAPENDEAEEPESPIFEAPLPTSLNTWIEPPVLPQGRLTSKPDAVDFGKMEFKLFGAVVGFSSSFEADPTWGIGLSARLPIDGISSSFGVFGQVLFSYLERDIPFYYTNRAGNWAAFAVGVDYTFAKSETAFFRGQFGALYAWFDDLHALADGWGVLLGADIGFYWIKRTPTTSFNINPQITTNGSDMIYIITLGFEISF